MKLALVTTPPPARARLGESNESRIRELARVCDLALFVEDVRAGGSFEGIALRPASALDPRAFDSLLYDVGDEREHAFMLPMLRTLGGTVALREWVLFDLALAAFPALSRGGWKGQALALREGGLAQARVYYQQMRERRAAKSGLRVDAIEKGWLHEEDLTAAATPFVFGWHAPEEGGRWSSDAAVLNLPRERVRMELHASAPRELLVRRGREVVARHRFRAGGNPVHVEVDLRNATGSAVLLVVRGMQVLDDQLRRGDARRLGVFVTRIEVESEGGLRELDLAQPCTHPPRMPRLDDRRADLPLNRSVVRFGDAFLVHSEHVRRRILAERNAPTPIAIVSHGAERAWRDDDRRTERELLAMPPQFRDAFLVASAGARVDVLLRAVALARKTHPAVRLALIGALDGELDTPALVQRLGLGEAVLLAGEIDVEVGRRYLLASDLAVQSSSVGSSSGATADSIFAALGAGRGVIASATDEQRELPGSCVVLVESGRDEVERLAAVLIELCDSPARRAELERGAREFVERECDWKIVAAKTIEHLERFPAPRSARKSLLARGLASRSRERSEHP